MKKIITICAAILMTSTVFAQSPNKMSYQAVIRNSSNALVTSSTVGMRISILQTTPSGTAVYVESQTPTTNINGLVSIEIGGGTVLSGNFANINWANGPYFVKTETDPAGGASYSITGTSQLLSVPYALYAANGGTPGPVGGFTHYLGEPYLGGIIFYLYKGSDGLEHGLIVAPTQSTSLAWQTSPTLVNANRTEDGAYNTALMTGSPAATYIASLGAGWYLPSIDELTKLWDNRYDVQKALRTGGYTLLSYNPFPSNYWSSTEYDATNALVFDFTTCAVATNGKTSSFQYVRGVRAF